MGSWADERIGRGYSSDHAEPACRETKSAFDGRNRLHAETQHDYRRRWLGAHPQPVKCMHCGLVIAYQRTEDGRLVGERTTSRGGNVYVWVEPGAPLGCGHCCRDTPSVGDRRLTA